ncbi:MAG: hypothetical protein ACOCXN_06615 [Spirochaetota bacterium]
MVRVVRGLVIVLLALGPNGLAHAQAEEPAWLVIERAERLLDEAEFGLAIRAYRRALDLAPGTPEALLGLGRTYKAIADYEVAEDYFRRALEQRGAFEVPDLAFVVRYERADIYRTRRDFARYEQELSQIVAEDPPPEESLIPDGVHLILAEQDLERFLVLYRLPESASTRARGMLAELLVGLGRYNAAAEQAALAVLQSFTTLIDAAIERDPTYEFTTVGGLLERARADEVMEAYLSESALFHDLYYAAAAFWGERNDAAFDLWTTLSEIDPNGTWGARAARRLADPQTEPLLIPGR